ncbi:MAG TPA: ThuA domain-containing protein [Cyclobacteriaceae bacterium]|nr:ThuA domain-containing protein [Cyclobacteriaceae bacterium]
MRLFLVILLSGLATIASAQKFRMLVLAERDKNHTPYVEAAKPWLDKLAAENDFAVDYFEHPDKVNDEFLSKYKMIFQMNYPPYMWSDTAKAAFEKYIDEGRGGWVGVHHATLLGEFDGYKMWDWFSKFMGSIRFKSYIATFASGVVKVEAQRHPVMKGIPKEFTIEKDEWYTYDRSNRNDVTVLASVDESRYVPKTDKLMGDHPVIWTNEKKKARNVYIFMGHDPVLFKDDVYKRLLRNALMWAAGK